MELCLATAIALYQGSHVSPFAERGSHQSIGYNVTNDENDSDSTTRSSDQAYTRFDTSSNDFRASHPEDTFSGASEVLFEQAMAQTRMAICLTDPNLPDNPIVFANRAFRNLTGYDEDEILGRNCRFLQGPDTRAEPVAQLRKAIEDEDVTVVELLNYRKDGSSFWNALHLGPIYDDNGRLAYLFGSQWDVSDVRAARAEERHARLLARELSHRMKNMFSVIAGIVSVTGRVRGVENEAREINQRIQALGRAYETTLDDASRGSIEVGEAIRAILAPYDTNGPRLQFRGNGARVSFNTVSMIGLILHELAANSTEHGAWSAPEGEVVVDWNTPEPGEDLRIDWVESGGPEVVESDISSGTGTAITERLLKAGNGRIERHWNPSGLHAIIKMPV